MLCCKLFSCLVVQLISYQLFSCSVVQASLAQLVSCSVNELMSYSVAVWCLVVSYSVVQLNSCQLSSRHVIQVFRFQLFCPAESCSNDQLSSWSVVHVVSCSEFCGCAVVQLSCSVVQLSAVYLSSGSLFSGSVGLLFSWHMFSCSVARRSGFPLVSCSDVSGIVDRLTSC